MSSRLRLVVALVWLVGCLDSRVERRVTRSDHSLVRSDAMHVAVCGSGAGAPDDLRAGPCTAIMAAGKLFLVDVGAGAWESADLIGLPIEHLRAVFLTKLLADDVADLGEAVVRTWLVGRTERLAVYGPAGTTRVVRALARAYEPDMALRVAHHDPAVLRPETAGAEPHEFTLRAGADSAVVFDEDGLRITAFAVGWRPDLASVGYRFDYRGRVVVVAGHSRGHPNVVAFARGADVLVHEATNHEMIVLGITQWSGSEWTARRGSGARCSGRTRRPSRRRRSHGTPA